MRANQAIWVILAAGTRVNKSFRYQLCAVSDVVADLSTIVNIPLLLDRPSRVVTSQQLQLLNSSQPGSARYSVFLPAALAFFQRALAAAAIFARLAALILRLAFLTGFAADFRPLTFAHRAFWAATILALPAALILRFFFGAAPI